MHHIVYHRMHPADCEPAKAQEVSLSTTYPCKRLFASYRHENHISDEEAILQNKTQYKAYTAFTGVWKPKTRAVACEKHRCLQQLAVALPHYQ